MFIEAAGNFENFYIYILYTYLKCANNDHNFIKLDGTMYEAINTKISR